MASTYENDLRLEEMATGENSGSWGTKTNTNLELVADAFSYGTETIADADTAITIADGAADAARSLALKINSSEDLTTTRVVTLGPNTTSKVWIIENNTSGGQTLTISAGSGSNVTLPNGVTKIIATDGIGAAANVTELYTNLHNITIDGILSLADGTNSAPSLTNTGDTNTGLYFPAADEVGLTVGGTQRLNINSTGSTLTGIAISNGLTLNTLALPSAGTATLFNRNTDNNLYIQTSSGNTVYLLDGSQNTMYAAAPTSHSFAISNVGVNTITATESVFNETGLDRDFRVESDGYSSMLKVDGGGNYVSIQNAGDLGGQLNIAGLTGIRGQKTGSYKIASMIRPTAFGYSVGTYGVTMLGDGNTQGTVSIGYDPSSNTSGAFTGNGGEMLFRNEMQFVTPNSADDGYLQHFKLGDSGTVFNDTSKDLDFRVESDATSHMLFVNAGTDTVQIRSSTNPSFGTFPLPSLYAKGTTDGKYGIVHFEGQADNSVLGLGHDATGNYFVFNASYRDTGAFSSLQFHDPNNQSALTIGMESSTAESVFNDNGANKDFRVESVNNANCFVLDAGADEIYLGKSSGAGTAVGGIIHAKSNRFYQFLTETSTNADDAIIYLNRQSSDGKAIFFRRANSSVGSITVSTSATQYNTTSDRRLKDNIEPIADGTEKLMAMKPVTHTWKADPEADAVHGFIAQEMQEIVPEAVSGDPDGEEMMSMDYGRITPVLVAALQDAHNKITALETRLAEMEAN